MSTRRHARVAVVGMLYSVAMGNAGTIKNPIDFLESKKLRGKQRDFAMELFKGAIDKKDEIDKIIVPQLKKWDYERIGQIEKAILRLGAYELFFTQTDAPIIINEAVEISKELADDAAPSFVNGIMDGLKKLKKQEE